ATQRPDRDTVPPVVKANLGGRIALQVGSQTNSRIILDQGGAEELLGKGDLYANLGRGIVRAQAPPVHALARPCPPAGPLPFVPAFPESASCGPWSARASRNRSTPPFGSCSASRSSSCSRRSASTASPGTSRAKPYSDSSSCNTT